MKKLIITLIVGALLALPLSALALEEMSGDDLGGIAGQAGIRIGFDGAQTTTITFDSISWGDPDGVAGATCRGFLIIAGSTGIQITQTIPDGEVLTLDVATVCAGNTFTIGGGSNTLIAGTSFLSVGLPTINMSITVPETMTLGLGNQARTVDGTLGILNLENLTIAQTMPNALIIWAD